MNLSRLYTKQFIEHVSKFMELHKLMPTHKKAIIAVSGGVDSLALMFVLKSILGTNLKVLHINHGTRPENIYEENLVLEHAAKIGLEVDVVKFQMDIAQSNFESLARNLRAEVYKQYLSKNYYVYTAHHLDDSFEWSMIQSFKQSRIKSMLGIPVFNRGLVRPFMCVSKNQIRKYAKSLALTWAEDSSNRDNRFERNFFRASLSDIISKRYPQYLRHYVSRHNQLAHELQIHRINHIQKLNPHNISKIFEKREHSGGVVLRSRNFLFHKEQIKEWIHFFSSKLRGETDREIDKLISAHQKIQIDSREPKIKGPLSFSGGVKVFLLGEYLLISNERILRFYEDFDESMLNYLRKNHAQITCSELKFDRTKVIYPYLGLLSDRDSQYKSKMIHPLLPKTCKFLYDKNVPYSFYPLIQRKGTQKLHQAFVLLDSSLVDL
jgi:tRNA(Ile)-lysidine synthase